MIRIIQIVTISIYIYIYIHTYIHTLLLLIIILIIMIMMIIAILIKKGDDVRDHGRAVRGGGREALQVRPGGDEKYT